MNRSCDAKTCNMSYNQHNMCKPFGPILVCLLPIKYHHSYCCPLFLVLLITMLKMLAYVSITRPCWLSDQIIMQMPTEITHTVLTIRGIILLYSKAHSILYVCFITETILFTLETLLFTIILKKMPILRHITTDTS